MAQNLSTPRGSLARRRPAQPQRRRHGGGGCGRTGATGWKDTAEVHQSEAVSSNRGSDQSVGSASGSAGGGGSVRGGNGRVGVGGEPGSGGATDAGGDSGGAGNSCTPNSNLRAGGSSGSGAGNGGTRTRGSAGSSGGEAWGKSSSGADVWAWAGGGGGAARGKAMLSAYGIPSERHTPTCSRGLHIEGGSRHNRGQRSQGSSVRQGDTSCVGGGVGAVDEARDSSAEDGAAVGTMRCTNMVASDRTARGHGAHNHRGRKGGRKQRSSAASSSSHGRTRHRLPSSGEKDRSVWITEDGGSDGVGQALFGAPASRGDEVDSVVAAPALSPRPIERLGPRERLSSRERLCRERVPDDQNRQSVDNFRQAFDDILVNTISIPPQQSLRTSSLPYPAGPPAAKATVTVARHGALLSMDGRGGSAAPPYRPPQFHLRVANPCTAAAATVAASNAPLLPDLVPSATGPGTVTVCDAESIGPRESRDGSFGADDRSTPPVSRQRAMSHGSPWQARKQLRGYSEVATAGTGGTRERENTAGSGRNHQSTGGDDQSAGVGFTSTDAVGDAGTTTAVPEIRRGCDGTDEIRTPQQPWAAPSASFVQMADAHSVLSEDGTYEHPIPAGAIAVRGGRSLDPFGRLLPGSANATTPQSELIDHFKLASRPASRRGTRQQGADGEDAQPAFCLFSEHRGGGGNGVEGEVGLEADEGCRSRERSANGEADGRE